ncbi:MAG: xanthine dehydrogenase small subunit [Rhodobacteraceae bacterium]|nr:xanthine dehydrogenase small subunit [Paracoccaceae bacterium]
MTYRSEIRFLLNDTLVSTRDVAASDTLLDFLRLNRRLTGTKEGCAEGDCGACTVLVGRLGPDGLSYAPVNACIRFLASLDGCHVVTVEYLAGPDGALHPVQRAMVEHHASQCGFCTPGFVMALYALWMAVPHPTELQIAHALQCNLCRCTGYAPIIRAAKAVSEYDTPSQDHLTRERDAISARLQGLRDGARVDLAARGQRAILPATVDDLVQVLAEHPGATVIAGATDVGLWVTKFLRDISPAVFIGHLVGLQRITRDGDTLRIGAGVSYSAAEEAIARHLPHLTEYWSRIAGWQVRSMGTVGGNIANGSPIGDLPPPLIALGAHVVLKRAGQSREVPLEAFFLDYGKQDRAPDELLTEIVVPLPDAGTFHAAYKISKRRDEDISALAAGFALRVEAGVIVEARIAFGGMAGGPARARHAEAALTGQPWSEDSLIRASSELPRDFSPLSDMRASADYRMRAGQNLFRRFWLEQDAGARDAQLAPA